MKLFYILAISFFFIGCESVVDDNSIVYSENREPLEWAQFDNSGVEYATDGDSVYFAGCSELLEAVSMVLPEELRPDTPKTFTVSLWESNGEQSSKAATVMIDSSGVVTDNGSVLGYDVYYNGISYEIIK